MHKLKLKSICLVLAGLNLMLSVGCSGDPKLSSEGYQQAIALFNVCSRKDTAALDRLEQTITNRQADSTQAPAELALFAKIIDLARNGNWDAAVARTRKLMEAQVSDQPSRHPQGSMPQHNH